MQYHHYPNIGEPGFPARTGCIDPVNCATFFNGVERRCCSLASIADVSRQMCGIVANAPEESRLDLVKAWQTQEVQAWGRAHASTVDGLTVCVERCTLDPAEVVLVTDGPDDRRDAGSLQVEVVDRRIRS